MTEPTVLIVEDELKLAKILGEYFLLENFNAHIIGDGAEVIDWIKSNDPAAVLLDVMLPGKDGLTLCREIREFSQVPILMVTARVDEIDRIMGLELGADDYICKPFSPREVVVRVKSILRRLQTISEPTYPWRLEEGTYEFHCRENFVSLTAIEFQLLKKLVGEPGRIFSRDSLMKDMYSDHRVVSERTIDSHVKKLRKKMSKTFPDEDFIESVYGVGYRFLA